MRGRALQPGPHAPGRLSTSSGRGLGRAPQAPPPGAVMDREGDGAPAPPQPGKKLTCARCVPSWPHSQTRVHRYTGRTPATLTPPPTPRPHACRRGGPFSAHVRTRAQQLSPPAQPPPSPAPGRHHAPPPPCQCPGAPGHTALLPSARPCARASSTLMRSHSLGPPLSVCVRGAGALHTHAQVHTHLPCPVGPLMHTYFHTSFCTLLHLALSQPLNHNRREQR